jgi:hypothetical protein
VIDKVLTTDDEAIEYLTAGRADDCILKLTNHFLDAREEGMTVQHAAEKAQAAHDYYDHGAESHIPAEWPYSTDEEIEDILAKPANADQEYAALAIDIFRRFRSYGFNLFFSAMKTLETVEWEWYQVPEHNESIDVVRGIIREIEDTTVRAIVETTFENEINRGTGVHFAGKAAEKAGTEAMQIADLFNIMGQRQQPNRLN